ncbi:MAG TPA: VWA domain-containing protein [Thermoanaerobaculia bacterium]|nr:VWA domain-containing protein [Thermoanaerobaculia bacterium]
MRIFALLCVAAGFSPLFGGLKAAATQDQQYQEKIVVERILIDARVTDSRGNPITGLSAADFRVRVDGKPAKVESADWIPETVAARELAEIDRPPAEVNNTLNVPAPRGRLFVFFFQTDFARNAPRVLGQMQILQKLDSFLDFLEPDDRVAVLSFDSHLKFRLDFTDDKHRIAAAMQDALLINEPNTPVIVPMPSLRSHLDPALLKNAKSSEEALLIIGNALISIPGPKSMILFGWGLGRLSGGRVMMEHAYPAARQALETSRTSVFSLDFTQADAHSLAVGLGQVSGDTGGFYASTFRFPDIAIQRLQKTLAGHYELEVRKPDTNVRGLHTIEVDVERRGADVLARSTYVDRD